MCLTPPATVPTAGVEPELAMRLLRASGDQLAAGALEQLGRMAGQVGGWLVGSLDTTRYRCALHTPTGCRHQRLEQLCKGYRGGWAGLGT